MNTSEQSKCLSLEAAQAIIVAAKERAAQLETQMNIAVIDRGNNLKAFLRMDGAWLGSIDIAIRKAKTANSFDMPTGAIGALSQPGGPLFSIEHSNDGLITFPGGLPIYSDDGSIIGAIGVSGSTVENDHLVAKAGCENLGPPPATA
ncbi:GlcG/HbpS family heme-binding protein [Bremerella sp. P1]|uniref:GlcG/HbpS family heme-binding protein n=1 Tax=Bremerella sp. P1 TaxID=3026424 RepID=UPI0023682C1F|nr:heme-binding protein [Bremerella sp. P1]WDI41058.1 heme-binding protein [Bremerella sp. P1]